MEKATKKVSIVLAAVAVVVIAFVAFGTMVKQDKNRLHIAIAYDNTGPHSINSYEYNFLESCIRKFEERHPQAVVTVDSIPVESYSDWLYQRMLFGDLPDVFTVLPQDYPMYMEMGLLEPLDKAAYADSISDAVLEPWGWADGGLYALPYALSPPCLLVNNNLLEDGKKSIDEYIFDWMDLYYYCMKYTVEFNDEKGTGQLGISNMDWRTAVYANGQVLFDTQKGVTRFNHPDVEYAVKFATSLNRLSLKDFPAAFEEQRALMKVASLAEARYYAENHPEIDLEILPIPKGPDGRYMTEPYNSAFGVNKASASQALAAEFLHFVVLDETQQMNLFVNSYSFPVLLSLQDSEPVRWNMAKHITEENYEKVFRQSYTVPVDFIEYYELMDVADKEIFQYIQGSTDIAYELGVLNERMEEMLKASLEGSGRGM